MLTIGPLAFATPWLLVALAALPVLWWLLRVTPPAPRRIRFPAIRLLADLLPPEETPAHTPWWLLLLRVAVAALVVLALAQPLLNPERGMSGSGPLVLVIDNGWSSAKRWAERRDAALAAIDRARRAERPVYVAQTAPAPPDERGPLAQAIAGPLSPDQARSHVQALEPRPWPVDRAAVTAAIGTLTLTGSANVIWLADGYADAAAEALAERLQRLGGLRVVADPPARLAKLLAWGDPAGVGRSGELALRVLRASADAAGTAPAAAAPERVLVRAVGADGRLVARLEVDLAPDAAAARKPIELPLELRNRIARMEIEGESHAGAVLLADERWRRRPVGIVTDRPLDGGQPLLDETFYISRALAPFAEIRTGSAQELTRSGIAVLALQDSSGLAAADVAALRTWMEAGGLVLRFAGPQLAASAESARSGAEESLLPVRLRRGDRVLGGALSWSQPARLAPFEPTSPFAGLVIPADVTVSRQVLAEPTLELSAKTWARLEDGTPLVTGEKRGNGWLALVHTTANTEWSSLPISGLFVEMLRRMTALSQGVATAQDSGQLAPIETADGYGRLGAPPVSARPIDAAGFAATIVEPHHPPGFYGTEAARRALNLSDRLVRGPGTPPGTPLRPLTSAAVGVPLDSYERGAEQPLQAWLLAAALLLLAADALIALRLRGLIGRRWRPMAAAGTARAAAVAALLLLPSAALAQTMERQGAIDPKIVEGTFETRLAYLVTGVGEADRATQAGLAGLSLILNRRTAIEAADPVGLDPAKDELLFYPLIFWTIDPAHPPLAARAIEQLNRYMRTGGTLFVDTRDHGRIAPGSFGSGTTIGPGALRLRQIAPALKIPSLVPVDPDHVLTKAFYLLQEFPGRVAGGSLWVERTAETNMDGVASFILAANDHVGAWAITEARQPMFPVIPGNDRQREFAYRFGVNLVMYALTGNYKADQVHVPAILERLGQ